MCAALVGAWPRGVPGNTQHGGFITISIEVTIIVLLTGLLLYAGTVRADLPGLTWHGALNNSVAPAPSCRGEAPSSAPATTRPAGIPAVATAGRPAGAPRSTVSTGQYQETKGRDRQELSPHQPIVQNRAGLIRTKRPDARHVSFPILSSGQRGRGNAGEGRS